MSSLALQQASGAPPDVTVVSDVPKHGRLEPGMRAFLYDALEEGMASGKFGGLPISGNVPAALIEMLRRLRWNVSIRVFAGAMPHFPVNFGIDELRAVLQRLGFTSQLRSIRGRDLDQLPPSSLVVGPEGGLRFIVRLKNGRLRLRDPEGGRDKWIWRRSTYKCLVVESESMRGRERPVREGWIGSVWRRFTPEIRTLFAITLLSNTLVVLASLSIGFIFDAVLPAKALDTLIALMLGLGGLFLLDLRLRRIRARIVGHISGRLEYIVGSALFSKLLELPLEMLTATSISDQISRLKQFETVRNFFSGPFVAVFFELPFVAILAGVILALNVPIGFLAIGLVAVYALIGALIFPRLTRVSASLAWDRNEHMRFVLETLSQRIQIARRGLAPMWCERLKVRSQRLARSQASADVATQFLNSLAGSITPLIAGCIIIFGASQVIKGAISGGTLIAITILMWRLLAPVQQAFLVAAKVPEVLSLFRQINAMMKIEGERRGAATHVQRRLEPQITFDSVVLRYPQTFAPALVGVSAQIEQGEFVAVTGPSGSGKSTILHAAMGLYRPLAGGIYLDDVNIGQLTRKELSANVAYVSNQPLLFYGTIRQNLLIAAPESSFEDLCRIADELGFLKTIEALPLGFDQRLDHATQARVTPGFRRQLVIAQAMLRNTGVLLLDEPEAGLSPEDEASLIAAILSRRGRVTCLVVTQRPSLMRRADRVMTMNAGRLANFAAPQTREG